MPQKGHIFRWTFQLVAFGKDIQVNLPYDLIELIFYFLGNMTNFKLLTVSQKTYTPKDDEAQLPPTLLKF